MHAVSDANNSVQLSFDVNKTTNLLTSLFTSNTDSSTKVVVNAPCGSLLQSTICDSKLSENLSKIESQLLDSQKTVLSDMLLSHVTGKHLCLLGAKGSGKSFLSRQFASLMGYKVRSFPLYQDMTQRDLLQRRVTVSSQESGSSDSLSDSTTIAKPNSMMSGWVDSPLITAARNGDVCILDGIDRLDSHVLHSLRTLLSTGPEGKTSFVDLPNGERLSRADGSIHPSFRIVALGLIPGTSTSAIKDARDRWVSSDWGFDYHFLQQPVTNSLTDLLRKNALSGVANDSANTNNNEQVILLLKSLLTSLNDNNTLSSAKDLHLSLRQVLRLYSLLSTQQAHTTPSSNTLTIGDTSMSRKPRGEHPEKIPNPLFYANQAHHATLEGLMQTLNAGEKALLLIGNQGVGKNKLVDRLLHLLQAEREYIQLHRDTTVQSLLLIPLLENGRIVYQDSPLLVAARTGRVAVLDEADKAPLEVVCMLKSLVEDGEIVLSDGRRLLSHARLIAEGSNPLNPPVDCVAIHPDFILFVLANRPGFPFLGNDFFRECGDIFSVHIIDHLDLHSEAALLSQYGGKEVSPEMIMKIAKSFAELRNMYGQTATQVETKTMNGKVDKNAKISPPSQVLTYPFSPREAVSIVKHLAKFPKDSIHEAVENIIAFDTLTPRLKQQVTSVFSKNGLKIGATEQVTRWEIVQIPGDGIGNGEVSISAQSEADRQGAIPKTGTDTPKHGKVDPDNTPHVGGNTWAGGTGGSDTAGLGGRGGPYRLDAGHTVHQVSDEIKAAMSAESKAKAKAMSVAAMAERLKEINMGARDFTTYSKYKAKVENQIHQLRSILEELSRRKSERVWLRHQSHGDLDDSKLVDGLSGDKLVFKRRGSPVDQNNAFHSDNNTGDNNGGENKKLFQFVVDVSGSMYRFNGRDMRLERMLESVLLVLETFPTSGDGSQPRANNTQQIEMSDNELNIDYSITGHSGDHHDVSFVDFNVNKPSNEAERFKVLETMIMHTAYCQSGDNTLEAVQWAVSNMDKQANSVVQSGADGGKIDKYILAVSDANFERYGINVADLARIMTRAKDRGIHVHFILIASFGPEAADIAAQLPAGQAHICHESQKWWGDTISELCNKHGTGPQSVKEIDLNLANHLALEKIVNCTTNTCVSNATTDAMKYVLLLEDDAFVSTTALTQIAEMLLSDPEKGSNADLYWLCDSNCAQPPFFKPPEPLMSAYFTNAYPEQVAKTTAAVMVSLPTVRKMLNKGNWIPAYRAIDHWYNYLIQKEKLSVKHAFPPVICHGSHGIEKSLSMGHRGRDSHENCCEDFYDLRTMQPIFSGMVLEKKVNYLSSEQTE
eukprot:gene25897-32404_t